MRSALPYLWMIWVAVTAVLTVVVVYGNTLSMREDDQLYLNPAEQVMMGSEQKVLITKMRGLAHTAIGLAVFSGVLFVACVGTWFWIGLSN